MITLNYNDYEIPIEMKKKIIIKKFNIANKKIVKYYLYI